MNPRFRAPAVAGAFLVALATVAACTASASPSAPTASAATGTPPSGSAAAGGIYPLIISKELIVGENRIIFAFQDVSGKPLGAPDRTAKISFSGPGGERVSAPDGEFVWAIQDTVGIYVTHAKFPVPGDWMASFTTAAPGSPEQTIPFSFQVATDASVVWPGEKAPSVDTPTLADVGGDASKISTDPHPESRFYETSVADALAAHKPFVLVFATPKFCQTKTCGPTLDKVKEVAAKHPDLTFINVEPYLLEDVDGQLQPKYDSSGGFQAAPATTAYGLLVEPFVFVVDKDGVVTDSFELVFTPEEIEQAIAKLS